MVGHTGVIPAAVAAVEAVDEGVGKVLAALKRKGGTALLTADHGNADRMLAEDGSPFTAHTTALVPLCLLDYSGRDLRFARDKGALCNLAPTLLDIIGLRRRWTSRASSANSASVWALHEGRCLG